MSGEGRGVMSVMAARAGELMAEPGEREVLVAMLAADKDDLKPGRVAGRGGAVGGGSSIVEASGPGLVLTSARPVDWDGLGEVDRSVWWWRPWFPGDRAGTGALVEGLRMWNLGIESKEDVSMGARAAFWSKAHWFRCPAAGISNGGSSEDVPGSSRGSWRAATGS